MDNRWNVYKSIYTGQWIVWSLAWGITADPLRFDTWQQAMDYVNRRLES